MHPHARSRRRCWRIRRIEPHTVVSQTRPRFKAHACTHVANQHHTRTTNTTNTTHTTHTHTTHTAHTPPRARSPATHPSTPPHRPLARPPVHPHTPSTTTHTRVRTRYAAHHSVAHSTTRPSAHPRPAPHPPRPTAHPPSHSHHMSTGPQCDGPPLLPRPHHSFLSPIRPHPVSRNKDRHRRRRPPPPYIPHTPTALPHPSSTPYTLPHGFQQSLTHHTDRPPAHFSTRHPSESPPRIHVWHRPLAHSPIASRPPPTIPMRFAVFTPFSLSRTHACPRPPPLPSSIPYPSVQHRPYPNSRTHAHARHHSPISVFATCTTPPSRSALSAARDPHTCPSCGHPAAPIRVPRLVSRVVPPTHGCISPAFIATRSQTRTRKEQSHHRHHHHWPTPLRSAHAPYATPARTSWQCAEPPQTTHCWPASVRSTHLTKRARATES